MDSSYLTTQVSTIIGQLHGLFDEIGVPHHERESRESELFTALSETLHNHLRLVTAEKNELTEEAYRIIKSIRQMEASLEDHKSNDNYTLEDEELKATVPLQQCIKGLKEKHNAVAKVHRERFEQVKKLVIALESYSSHLEQSFLKVRLPPTAPNASIPPTFDLSPSYLASLDREFSRVYEEYTRRVATVQAIAEEIVGLWAELGTPQSQTDGAIVKHYRDAPEQLGLHEADMTRLQSRRDKLSEEKRSREKKLKDMRTSIEGLWDRLGVEDMDRKRFLAGARGCGLRVINDFEAELDRLNELKRQNLHLFVEDARYKLQELWDALYFSEEEMLDFTPAFSDVYSDALLSAHEDELARLEALKEQRLPMLQLIDKHRSLVKDRDDLAASSQDASRLMLKGQKGEKRDPGKLLREEKMRKRIAKDLPKVEAELRKTLERWEDEYGRSFLVHGERYLDELAAAAAKTVPPRSKTPNALIPANTGPKAVKATPAASRANSVMRPPPPRPGAKTPTTTLRSNPVPASAAGSTLRAKSPSKIPARVPLSAMKTGNNSPERRAMPPPQSKEYNAATIRKMGPPRAPPPKMRDLFAHPPAPTPTSATESENWRCESAASSINGGLVRNITPEDVYDDREHMSYAPPSFPNSASAYVNLQHSYPASTSSYESRQTHQSAQNPYEKHRTQSARQISVTSASSNAPSGSENWETFDDTSEVDEEAQDQHYAKVKPAAIQAGKRFAPEGGYSPRPGMEGKRMKASAGGGGTASIYSHHHAQGQVYVGQDGRVVSASDAGWTDEDAF